MSEDYTYEDYLREIHECPHEFENGVPSKPSDKCKWCGKTAKELGLFNK